MQEMQTRLGSSRLISDNRSAQLDYFLPERAASSQLNELTGDGVPAEVCGIPRNELPT